MTKDLLWEVGVEEIPARFLPPAIKQMEQLAREAFGEAGLAYDELHTYATPRRLTLAIAGLAEKAADVESEVKGPAKKAAFDADGQPTRALEGFCRGQGVTIDQLMEKELNGNIYKMCIRDSVTNQSKKLIKIYMLLQQFALPPV